VENKPNVLDILDLWCTYFRPRT